MTDVDGMERASQRWETDLRPGATGYLGVTEGVTDDNKFVVTLTNGTANGAGVMQHFVDGDGQRVVVAEHDHGQRIADQD